MSEKTDLFKEFTPVSAKEWKQQIQMELKGADYTDTLVWQSLEGIDIKPFYHAEEYEYLEIPTSEEDFKIVQPIFVDDPAIANKLALEAIEKGADAIQFIANKSFDIDVLFQGFKTLKFTPTIFFKAQFQSNLFIESILNYFDNDSVVIQQDVVGKLSLSGNWFSDEFKDFESLKKLTIKYPNRQILSVDVSIYQNAGANIIQQIAYALTHASDYLNAFAKNISHIQFEFAIGSNYFFEIAKLRAFRYLWKQLMKEYNADIEISILAKPTKRNKTLYDYNVNMLRTSTEYMSAVLGGADFVITQAYDAIFKKSNHFSARIGRNQLLLLREENTFENPQNFAKGSYYIETLTLEISKKALQLFKDLDKSGGFVSSLKSGLIQKKINEAAKKEQDLFDAGNLTLVGSNKYPNTNDTMKDAMELYPFLKIKNNQTAVQPVFGKRLAEKLEQKRLNQE